jgi:hypothetical protein
LGNAAESHFPKLSFGFDLSMILKTKEAEGYSLNLSLDREFSQIQNLILALIYP